MPAAFHCRDMGDGVEAETSFDKYYDATGAR